MNDELTDLWEYLYRAIEQVYNGDTISNIEKMTFYSKVAKYCSCSAKNGSEHPQRRGRHLYANLLDFFKFYLSQFLNHLESISDDEKLMTDYMDCWIKYRNGSALLDGLCRYLNVNWLPIEMENNNNVYTVYRTALIAFKIEILDKIDNPLINAVSDSIDAAILNEVVNKNLVCSVMESFVELYSNDKKERQTVTVIKKMENVFRAYRVQFYETNSKSVLRNLLFNEKYNELKKRFPNLFLNLKDHFMDLSEIMKENLWDHLIKIFNDNEKDNTKENIGKCLKFYTFFSEHCAQDKIEENWNKKYLWEFFKTRFNDQKVEMEKLRNNEEILNKYLNFCNDYSKAFLVLDEWCDSVNENNVKDDNTTYKVSKWCQKKWNEHNLINELIANAIYKYVTNCDPKLLVVENTMQQLAVNGNSEVRRLLKSMIENDILNQLKGATLNVTNVVNFMKNISKLLRHWEDFMWQVFPNNSDLWITSLSIPSENWKQENLSEFLNQHFHNQEKELQLIALSGANYEKVLLKYLDFCNEYKTAKLILNNCYKSINENHVKQNHIMFKLYKWCLAKWNEHNSINELIANVIYKYVTNCGPIPLVESTMLELTFNGNSEVTRLLKSMIEKDILIQLKKVTLNVTNLVNFIKNISELFQHWEDLMRRAFPDNSDLRITSLSIPSENWKQEDLSEFLNRLFDIHESELQLARDNHEQVLLKYLDYCNEYRNAIRILNESINKNYVELKRIMYELYKWCLTKWNEHKSINDLIANAIFNYLTEAGPSFLIDNVTRTLKEMHNLNITTYLQSIINNDFACQLEEVLPNNNNTVTFMRNILKLLINTEDLLWSVFPDTPELWIQCLPEDSNKEHLEIYFSYQNVEIKSLADNKEQILKKYLAYCNEYADAIQILNNSRISNHEIREIDKAAAEEVYAWCIKMWNKYNSINKLIANAIFIHFTETGPSILVDDVMKQLDENGNMEIKRELRSIMIKDLECPLGEVLPKENNVIIFLKNIFNLLRNTQDLWWSVFPNNKDMWITNAALKSFVKRHKNPSFPANRSASEAARYCDQLLRNPRKSEEKHFEYAMFLLEYFDFCVFYKAYSELQAFRLLEQSVSIDDEALFVEIMELCATTQQEILVNMKRMIKDFKVFNEFNASFMERNFPKSLKNVSVVAIDSSYWPLKVSPKINLPPQLLECLELFETFFPTYKKINNHSKRNLCKSRKINNWSYFTSQADLQFNTNRTSYTLRANFYQVVVLLQFNDQLSHTVQNLMDICGVDLEHLKSILQSLIRIKLLAIDGSTQMTNASIVQLSTAYTSTENYINIAPTHELTTRGPDLIEPIRALIMRIMKKVKTMDHQPLISEVKTGFSQLCELEVKVIEKEIEHLIKTDFLRCIEGPKKSYEYIP